MKKLLNEWVSVSRRPAACLWVLAGLLLVCGAWNAQANIWTNVAGGLFSEGSNWKEGSPPGTSDIIYFYGDDSAGTYRITLTENVTVRKILMRYGGFKDVTMDLGGYEILAYGDTIVNWTDMAIETRIAPGEGPFNLTITNGTLTAGVMRLGAYDGTLVTNQSTLTVGAGATLVTTGEVDVARHNQHATLIVRDGGIWNRAVGGGTFTHVGFNPDTYGVIRVEGSGSVADMDSNDVGGQSFRVGYNGTGVIEAIDGGVFEGAQSLTLGGNDASAAGILRAEGENSSISTTTRSISSLSQPGRGQIVAKDGGTIHSGEFLDLDSTSTIEIDNGTVTAADRFYFNGCTYRLTLHEPNVVPMSTTGGITFTSGSPVTFELSLAPGFSADLDDEFVVCAYGTQTGTFIGLPDEGEIEVGDYTFQIDYGSGTNDKVTLTATKVPPRGSVFIVQ